VNTEKKSDTQEERKRHEDERPFVCEQNALIVPDSGNALANKYRLRRRVDPEMLKGRTLTWLRPGAAQLLRQVRPDLRNSRAALQAPKPWRL